MSKIIKPLMAVFLIPAVVFCAGPVFLYAEEQTPQPFSDKGKSAEGLAVWLVVFAVSRIVSLASLLSAAAIPSAAFIFNYGYSTRALVVILAALTIIRHKSNIMRLIKKDEKKVSSFPLCMKK